MAAGFPTTVNPILQFGAVPVFVDVDRHTHNIDVSQLELALIRQDQGDHAGPLAGQPVQPRTSSPAFRKAHGLWLVEDCCDALGSTYDGRKVGTFGDIATLSFYPAHHITMGEGGAVFTNNDELRTIAESFRDWGRDCYCAPGKDNTCGKRFGWTCEQLGGSLPAGYDHKYTYSHRGFNLKITDMQAACGVAQVAKAQSFIDARKRNFLILKEKLAACEEFVQLPQATPGSDPAWFGFPITLKDNAPRQPCGPAGLPGPAEDRHAAAVRRQPDAPALHAGAALPRGRRSRQHRPHHEQHLLDRRATRADAGHAGLRRPPHRDLPRRGLLRSPTMKTLTQPLFVLEMANNHMGDLDHGIQVIREFGAVCRGYPEFSFAFKLQYRDLDTFIHPSMQGRDDIKYIKRFSETRLTRAQFDTLVAEMRAQGFLVMATPFDEPSVGQIEDQKLDFLKIPSCSFNDWPLLERVVQTNLPIIASTAGAAVEDMDQVISFLLHRNKDFAILHCVGEYPTPDERMHLSQIDFLHNRYPGRRDRLLHA